MKTINLDYAQETSTGKTPPRIPLTKYQLERAIGKRRKPTNDKRWGKHAAQQNKNGAFGSSKSIVRN